MIYIQFCLRYFNECIILCLVGKRSWKINDSAEEKFSTYLRNVKPFEAMCSSSNALEMYFKLFILKGRGVFVQIRSNFQGRFVNVTPGATTHQIKS